MSSSETKACQNCNTAFVIDAEDFSFYEKMEVPAPTWCRECRFRQRCLFRNERTLYSRKCDLCECSIISVFNPKSPYTVYCHECWNSDKWDARSFEMEYNFNEPFFKQFNELLKRVPKVTTYTSSYQRNINSEYTNVAGGKAGNKNCYLLFNAGDCEDAMYSRGLRECREVLDAYFGNHIERCYETINVQRSSGIIFGQNINSCLDSTFLLNANGCQNCFGCVNLRYKNYHFLNEPLSKEEWHKRINAIMGSYSKMREFKKKFYEFSLKFPRREHNNTKAVNSSGDYIFESKNVHFGFEVSESENCKYVFSVKQVKDSYDLIGFGYESELLLDNVAVGFSSRVIGSCQVENSHDILHCVSMRSSEYCVGCEGLKNAKYVILNKRYDKNEYQKIKEHIVKELKEKNLYGLFMPKEISPFAYNETVGQDYLPLTKEESLARGFRWEDDIQITKGKETMRSYEIPDHIKDAPDSITNEILVCDSCGRNYKIIKAELEFYRKMILPIPRECFNCRHINRIKKNGLFKLYKRNCAKCQKPISTNFAPNQPEIVYCEQCYNNEVS